MTEYCTISEAAQLLRVSRSTVWRWIEAGELMAYRVGTRTIRIRRDDLRGLLRPAHAMRTRARDDIEAERIRDVERPDIWTNYDPEKVKAAFEAARGLLAGVDIEALKRDIREARGQDSKGRPAY